MACLNLKGLSVVLLFRIQASHALFSGLSVRASHRLPRLADDLTEKFIVVPEHKLLFCYIEKVACTNFNMLFRSVRARYHPEQLEGSDYHRNTPEVHGVDLAHLERILANSSWHKAVFYRDPVERFVSAFASKCEGADEDGPAHCQDQFGFPNISFGDAVQQIDDYDHNRADPHPFNRHFRLQSDFCGGLRNTLEYYDTVEELDRSTARAKVSTLLQKVGIEPSSVPHFDTLFPKPDDQDWKHSTHNTGVNDDLSDYFPEGEEWRISTLRHHYAEDYRRFYQEADQQFSDTDLPGMWHWPLVDELKLAGKRKD